MSERRRSARIRDRYEHEHEGSQGIQRIQENDEGTTKGTDKGRAHPVSVKDLAILISLSTTISSFLLVGVFGVDSILEKCKSSEATHVLGAFILFASAIFLLSYILLRLAAHYIVYLGIGIVISVIYPCHPKRVVECLQRIFSRKKKDNKRDDDKGS